MKFIQLKYAKYAILFLVFCINHSVYSQLNVKFNTEIRCGADRLDVLLPLLKEKKVALCGNQTSVLRNGTHLADTLLSAKVNLVKFLTPEHGLRGKADAGEKVNNSIDEKTKLPIVSLYGKNKKPTAEQLNDIDVIVFDLQDVGARFYTYISTLHYVMQACAENGKQIIVLDRPNPNGFYVDGPVLDTAFKSFIGMHPVPVVHGMTIGEYAQMIKGENWIKAKSTCNLTVISCLNYSHKDYYNITISPSPNLNSMQAIYYYPTTCFFEGTTVSVGRGTKYPFRNIGAPAFKKGKNYFTPMPTTGAKDPMYNGKKCRGIFISDSLVNAFLVHPQLDLGLIKFFYQNATDKKTFFVEKGSFNILAGNDKLKQQIKANVSDSEIRASWKPALDAFKVKRKTYLLYPDYE